MTTGVRLAKRHDALALRTLRAQGLTPADIRCPSSRRFPPSAASHGVRNDMTTLRTATLCAAATLLLVAGCKKTADNTSNYKSTLDNYYSTNHSCLWSTAQKFPTCR